MRQKMTSNRKENKSPRATNKLGDYSDEKEQLFTFLKKESKLGLLELLEEAFDEMPVKIRRSVFGDLMDKLRCSKIEGMNLLKEVNSFKRKSNNGDFYAAFNINSKNYMHVPEETEEWFDRLGDFLNAACELSKKKDHSNAISEFTW